MPHLNDQLNRNGNILGSSASPDGDVWFTFPSGLVAQDASVDGAKVVFASDEPSLFYNAEIAAGNDETAAMEFTPGGDNWTVSLMTRLNPATGTGYQLLVYPGGAAYIVRRDATSAGYNGSFTLTPAASNMAIAAGNRSSHTFAISISPSGVLTASIDDTALDFGGVIDDDTYTAAGYTGFGGRSGSSTFVTGDGTAGGGGDTTAPIITGPGGATGSTSAVGVAENTTAVATMTANETVTWSLNGGADAARFTINSGGNLAFSSAPDYEAPNDSDTNNTYVVVVRATDTATPTANTTDQTVTVTVTDVADTAGSYVISDLKNASGTLLTSLTINWLTFQRVSDGVQVLIRTNQVTNGSGDLAGSHASLVPGVAYIATGWDTAGANSFRQFVSVT